MIVLAGFHDELIEISCFKKKKLAWAFKLDPWGMIVVQDPVIHRPRTILSHVLPLSSVNHPMSVANGALKWLKGNL
ncbi:hypothetical protein POUND7_003863 [Theobroma cacao]